MSNPVENFATTLLRDWPPEVGVEGYDLLHIALRAGLLVETTERRPCGEHCRCVTAYDPHEWPAGVTCYRINPALRIPA